MRHFIGFLLVAVTGCGISESNVGATEPDPLEEGAELSATSRTFVQLRVDMRRCIAPLCGGYWVHDLSRATLSEVYVSGLDFTGSGLSDADQARVFEAIGEVVLRGKLGPTETRFNTRPFIVSEAYRGMPGLALGAGDQFYKLKTIDIQCFAAPCPSMAATRVNHTAQTLLTSLDLSGVGNRLELKWLSHRAIDNGALTTGTVVRSGGESSLVATNVFLRLPERMGPCPLSPVTQCAAGTVQTYTRSPDRCEIAAGCTTPGLCAQFLPTCDAGYQLSSWVGGRYACPQFVCDPAWIF